MLRISNFGFIVFMSQKQIIILIITVVIVIATYLIVFGFYPIALVNFNSIPAYKWEANLTAAYTYYQKSSNNSLTNKTQREIQRVILDKLIREQIVHQELKNKIKNSELDTIIDSKIKNFTADSQAPELVKNFYGLSMEKFDKLLIPVAEEEILEGRLFMENKSLNDWLKGKKSEANLIILLPDFSWDGEEIRLVE